MEAQRKAYNPLEINYQEENRDIFDDQQSLKEIREKVSPLTNKNIYIISSDFDIRDEIKAHLKTLGFWPQCVKAIHSSDEIINKIKQNVGGIDLIICPLKILNKSASSQTGLQLLKIVNEMLLNVGIYETIPVVFVEKSFVKKEIISALHVGASQFLVVPTNSISLGYKLVDVFKKEVSSFSQEISGLIIKANKLRDQGLFEKAVEIYNKALKVSSENIEALTEKANTLLEMGDIDQAIRIYKRVIEIEDKFPRAYQGLGKAYEQLGDVTKARKNYLKVLELEPHNVQVCYNIGVLYRRKAPMIMLKPFLKKV